MCFVHAWIKSVWLIKAWCVVTTIIRRDISVHAIVMLTSASIGRHCLVRILLEVCSVFLSKFACMTHWWCRRVQGMLALKCRELSRRTWSDKFKQFGHSEDKWREQCRWAEIRANVVLWRSYGDVIHENGISIWLFQPETNDHIQVALDSLSIIVAVISSWRDRLRASTWVSVRS